MVQKSNSIAETASGMRQDVSNFRERAPWWGGDLQTLRNYLISDRLILPGTTTLRSFPVSDGGDDRLSAPIEPVESCRQLMAPRNTLYHRFLLRRMKQDVLSSVALTHEQRRAVNSASSVYEFDDKFVAPCNGFLNAKDYYEKTAGARQVNSVDVPALMLHASNDPWVPASPYCTLQSRSPACVKITITRGGGHVGFHEQGNTETWHDQQIDGFLKRLRVA